tara:strand:+ start:137 stop:802 length:666 start_codon:yes stop_codon:yes gene_type:complete
MSYENKEKIGARNKAYYEANKEKIKAKRRENPNIEWREAYYQKNKEKIKERSRLRDRKLRAASEEFVEYQKQKNKAWYKKNKKKRIKQITVWQDAKRKKDPIYKLRHNISCLLRMSLRNRGYSKKSRTHSILGCAFEFFASHIEEKFQEGMTWENYGEWHLDHIVPVSLGEIEEEIIELNHYTNFQPLWKVENIRKANKLILDMVSDKNLIKYKNIIKRTV